MTTLKSVAALALGLVIACPDPAAAENVLRFTGFVPAKTFDPHSRFFTSNRTATEQVYEALLDVDSNFEIVPQLALAWKPLNPTTWEFELRRGVRFHDGTPLTAEDVVLNALARKLPISRISWAASPMWRRSTIRRSRSPPRGRTLCFG
jgi:peptide/nickel transport system substrate-binding protein